MLSRSLVSALLLTGLPVLAAPLDDMDTVLWLKADTGVVTDDAGHVSRWEDQSGTGHHFTAETAEQRPLLVDNGATGNPALRFDGVDDALTITTAPLPVAGRTVFAVVKWNAARAYSFALGCADGTDGYLRMGNATKLLTGGRYPLLHQNGIPFPKVGYAPGDGRQIFHEGLNNLLQWNIYAIPNPETAEERIKHLGKNEANNVPENRFSGDIAEVLVFDSVLPPDKRRKVEQYLGAKYLGWPAPVAVPVRESPADADGDETDMITLTPERPRILAHGVTDQPLVPGRYQVRFAMRSTAGEQEKITVRLGDDVQEIAIAAGSIDFVLPVDRPADTAIVRVVWEGAPSTNGSEQSRAAVRNLYIQRLSAVVVERIQLDKILYAPGQEANATVTVRNYSAEPQTVQVRCEEVTGLNDRRHVGILVAGEIPPGDSLEFPFWYDVGHIEYGRELSAEILQDGAVLDAASEPYSVADNLWKVAVGAPGGGPISSSARYTRESIAKQLQSARDNYCNWFEKQFWAPDDWGLMVTEPGATWFSGQARRHENTEKLQYQIQVAHGLGMKAITYGKCMAGGNHGWRLARKRPQWFVVDAYGRTMGRPADVWDMDHWQDEQLTYDDLKYVWTYRWVDLRRLDALDHGIDQLIASKRQFGWDGVRFDSGGFRAHFVPKNGEMVYNGVDSFNARNTKRMKKRLWEEFPDYLFGYNTNDPVHQRATKASAPRTPEDPTGHEFREMLAGGGLWMFEGMRERPHFFGRRTYKTWSDYATDMVDAIRTVKGYGGHVCFSYGDPTLYKYIIGTMIGAHDYVGAHTKAPGAENWGRFLTRWSSFVWDHRLRALPEPDQTVTLTSGRPIWWQEFANELIVSPSKRYVIIHLLNPPVNDEVTKTADERPRPVKDVEIVLRHTGEQVVRAMFIAPGTPNRAELVAGQRDKAGITLFGVPQIDIWGMLVVEMAGEYLQPPLQSDFTEPLNAAELAEMEDCKHTFNVPVAGDLFNPAPQFDAEKAAVKDFGTPAVTMPKDLEVGGQPGVDVLLIKGFYHETYRVPEALRAAAPEARVSECTARDLPQDYADLFKYDVVVLIDMGAEYWDADGHKRLADFARAGGRLVVLGGSFTLGQGFFKGTALEEVMPVNIRQARDVYQLPAPLPLGPENAVAFPQKPLLYFYHAVEPKADARVVLWASNLPVWFERTVEKGSTSVFIGTTMGEPTAEHQTPFWQWEGWPAVLGDILQ